MGWATWVLSNSRPLRLIVDDQYETGDREKGEIAWLMVLGRRPPAAVSLGVPVSILMSCVFITLRNSYDLCLPAHHPCGPLVSRAHDTVVTTLMIDACVAQIMFLRQENQRLAHECGKLRHENLMMAGACSRIFGFPRGTATGTGPRPRRNRT